MRHWVSFYMIFVCVLLIICGSSPAQDVAVPEYQHALVKTSDGQLVCKVVPVRGEDPFQARVPADSSPLIRKQVTIGNMTVDFTGFPAQAQTAFLQALVIMSALIDPEQEIRIEALYHDLDDLISTSLTRFVANFEEAPLQDTFYPFALGDQIAGRNLIAGEFDMRVEFDDLADWYFGLDGNPNAGEVDFITGALHELTHGLGFLGSFNIVSSQGRWGLQVSGGSEIFPTVYDLLVEDGAGSRLTDELIYPNPSFLLAFALTSNDVFFGGENAAAANGGAAPRLHAPTLFSPGFSVNHWDLDSLPLNSADRIMTGEFSPGEAHHNLGPLTIGVLRDIGWFQAPGQDLHLPQFGNGGNTVSEIVVFNPSASSFASGEILFWDADGNQLFSSGLVSGGTIFNLPPLAVRTFATNGQGALVSGSATVVSSSPISAVIRFFLPGAGIAGVGASPSLTAALAPVRRQGNLSTGVAFRNTSSMPIIIDLTLKDSNGNQVSNGARSVILAVNGRQSRFIQELFPRANTTDFQGTICLQARQGTFAAIALELETGPNPKFTTLPVSSIEP